jgi:hypothetical protein
MTAQHTPGPIAVLMTGEEGETWRCRCGNASGRVTNYWPSKQAADKEAERQRLLMGGTSCVERVSDLRIGQPAKATGATK